MKGPVGLIVLLAFLAGCGEPAAPIVDTLHVVVANDSRQSIDLQLEVAARDNVRFFEKQGTVAASHTWQALVVHERSADAYLHNHLKAHGEGRALIMDSGSTYGAAWGADMSRCPSHEATLVFTATGGETNALTSNVISMDAGRLNCGPPEASA